MKENIISKALVMALDDLFNKKSPVLYVDMDLSDREIVQNIINLKSGVKIQNIRSGFLTVADYEKVLTIMALIDEAPLHILDKSSKNIEQIKHAILKLSKENEMIKMFVDYEEKDMYLIEEVKNNSIIPITAIMKNYNDKIN